ncbi:hypothetical protein ACGF0J_36215 [Nonomuraea sp. NPDC047897]|uniref:hypothetical protein n=1 Tax=Nonomuraea sp. NPDC047897 TaxID=3364346 RepID=UPI00371342C4
MTSTLIEWAKSGEQPILVYGEPFSGKSTMVLRAVFDLEKEGWLVYEFNRRSRPDNSAVLQRVEDVPKTVLVVEGARDFESDLKNLAISAKERKLALRLLMIERKGAADRLLQSGLFHAIRVPAVVAEDEMMDLLAKLRDKGRLLRSASRGKSLPALLSHVSRAYNRVLSQTLANLVLGTGFQERVSHDYRALADPAVKSAFVLAAIVAAGGNSLPLGVAAEAVHLSGRALEKRMEVDQSLYSICYIRRGFLRPRHRLYGELLLGGVLAHRELYGPTIALATALAPFVTREAIRRRSIYHRIVRHLMDHNVLAGLIGRERIEGWYAELEGIYGWNARFWEQRALAASEEQVDDRAMQYALIAVDRYEDAYTLNTLATVRLRPIKRGRGPLKSTENVEFWEAVKDLERARERAAPDSEHPYVTFFDGAIGYGRRWRHSGADLPNALRVEWQAWWTAAQSSESFQHAKGHQALADFQRRWLELAPAPSAPTVDQPTNPTPDTSFLEGQ